MRILSKTLTTLMQSLYRQPRYIVYIWDILSSGAPEVGAIVAGSANTSYRLDVTQYVHSEIAISEPGDKRAAQATFTLSDILGSFNPISGQYATYVQRGQIVSVLAGDATIATTDYVGVFFGHIVGQSGYRLSREGIQKETTISCYSRLATPAWLKRRFVSPTYGASIDLGTIIQTTALNEMGLTGAELTRAPLLVGQATQFAVNSIVDLTAIEAIDKILEVVAHVSDFDGSGKLRSYSKDMRRSTDLYIDTSLVVDYEHPSSDTETYNSVKIIGLDKNISLLDQPVEALARATIPVGFWRPRHVVDVWWSNDHSLRAHDTQMVVETSVNDSLMFNIGTESYEEWTEYGGRIVVDLGFVLLTLALILGVIYIVMCATLPDPIVPLTGPTIPAAGGTLLRGIVQQLLFFVLAQTSSGVYEIQGIPTLPVYKEISATMTKDGTPDYLLNQKTIENDWVNTQEHLLALATVELLFEASQAAPRRLTIVDQLALEIGDILEVDIDGVPQRLWVEGLRRELRRDEEVPLLQVDTYKIPAGAF